MSLTYIQDDNFPWHISRYDFGSDVVERYSYPKGGWVRDGDLYDITIGKYWEFEEDKRGEGPYSHSSLCRGEKHVFPCWCDIVQLF